MSKRRDRTPDKLASFGHILSRVPEFRALKNEAKQRLTEGESEDSLRVYIKKRGEEEKLLGPRVFLP